MNLQLLDIIASSISLFVCFALREKYIVLVGKKRKNAGFMFICTQKDILDNSVKIQISVWMRHDMYLLNVKLSLWPSGDGEQVYPVHTNI